MERVGDLGRIRELEQAQKSMADTRFSLKLVSVCFSDPFAQVEYAYSLIESEAEEVE